jgi:queuine tRNA-ribosyltransferase
VTERLPRERPRYLMGVGTTRDLLEAVHRGVDMFDCILPTSLARQGVAFTSLGRRDLRRAAYRGMEGPLDPVCGCYTCKTHSVAYLFHLQRVHESTGWQLLGLHNTHFYLHLMRSMRAHIIGGTWLPFYHAQRDVLDARDSYGKPATHITRAALRRLRLKRGRYEVIVRDEIGYIRDTASGELMHAGGDPSDEARALYVEQSKLIERLQDGVAEPLVVWDVGLGAATNAMAAILAVEAAAVAAAAASTVVAAAVAPAPAARRLTLISFEHDLDALTLALDHLRLFKHLRHAAPRSLLNHGRWSNGASTIEWQLLTGDFAVRKFDAPAPDIIFFDPFSYKADGALWTLPAFRELARLCARRPVELFTYTCSTAIRSAMLAAGFYVAKGRGTGSKAETTIALSEPAARLPRRHELLGAEWLAKWRRSDARAPFGCGVADADADAEALDAVSAHPQFRTR